MGVCRSGGSSGTRTALVVVAHDILFSIPPSQLTIYHLLKLFQNDPAVIAGKKNVVSEQYDEMVDRNIVSGAYECHKCPTSVTD